MRGRGKSRSGNNNGQARFHGGSMQSAATSCSRHESACPTNVQLDWTGQEVLDAKQQFIKGNAQSVPLISLSHILTVLCLFSAPGKH